MAIAPSNKAEHPADAAPKSLVLVVDDQATNIQAVGALLVQGGHDVMPALSGEQALQRCEQRTPDLVLLDMRMPGMDGFEVCAKLRENPRTADVPIIFLTAAHEREVLVKAFESGAVDYVTKPFVAEELLARVKTHLELKSTRDRLAQLAQERAELTQVVAHDLKNPLAGILMGTETLAKAVLEAPQATALKGIRDSANRCLSFIDEYLGRWAQSEKPRTVELSAMVVKPILQDALAALRPVAEAQGLSLHLSMKDDPEVMANARSLRHIIDNLVSNAIKYGGTSGSGGGTIELEANVGRSGMLRITVGDRGPGVPADQHGNLFKRYVRLPGAEAAHSSGLGLAISKEEAERMGGHLWYEDRDGGGALFSLVLPLATDDDQPA
ncbi:MAG: hybrid sensor histidine kinase/response regulator [Stagnimonas sp.]|nr:hybrid sensor histidine kinase/response regulator [Stagnimonas sp.]